MKASDVKWPSMYYTEPINLNLKSREESVYLIHIENVGVVSIFTGLKADGKPCVKVRVGAYTNNCSSLYEEKKIPNSESRTLWLVADKKGHG